MLLSGLPLSDWLPSLVAAILKRKGFLIIVITITITTTKTITTTITIIIIIIIIQFKVFYDAPVT